MLLNYNWLISSIENIVILNYLGVYYAHTNFSEENITIKFIFLNSYKNKLGSQYLHSTQIITAVSIKILQVLILI
jgi:hypothetical protein